MTATNTNRRNFLKLSGGSILGTMMFSFPEIHIPDEVKTHGRIISPDDEHFWGVVRQQFPLNRDRIYLNNGTMGPSPYPVIEAVKNTIMDVDVHGNYGGWELTATRIAAFVKAKEEEITLTHNVTDGINIVCWGLPLKKGDEVIITTHEHVGNAFPWLNRAKLHGLVLRTFTPAATAEETLKRIDALINKKTKVIAVPHVPCTAGQVLPVKEISSLGKSKGLFVFIDGAHGPGMLPLDVAEIGCDFYASCCHKWMLGPKGTGFLYVRKEMQDTLQTYFVGGGSDTAGWNMMHSPPSMGNYAASAHRYYYGTQSSALYSGVNAAIDFIEGIGLDNFISRGRALAAYLQKELLAMGEGKIEMFTPVEEKSRANVIGFRIRKMPYDKFYSLASDSKIRIRMVAENDLKLIRVSAHVYNKKEEIDKLLELISREA